MFHRRLTAKSVKPRMHTVRFFFTFPCFSPRNHVRVSHPRTAPSRNRSKNDIQEVVGFAYLVETEEKKYLPNKTNRLNVAPIHDSNIIIRTSKTFKFPNGTSIPRRDILSRRENILSRPSAEDPQTRVGRRGIRELCVRCEIAATLRAGHSDYSTWRGRAARPIRKERIHDEGRG